MVYIKSMNDSDVLDEEWGKYYDSVDNWGVADSKR